MNATAAGALRFAGLVSSAGMVALSFTAAYCQDFPTKPIRLVVPGTGNSFDIAARLIAQGISGPLGQPVIVDNRANGTIAAETVAKAPPDGYTLLVNGSNLWLLPFLQSNVPYDPVRDFLPITLTTRSPTILVVHPSLPVKSVRDLIALAKSSPGRMNYASGSTGSTNHLAAELFKSMAGVNIVRIGYKGSGPALVDLIAGHVQMMFSVTGSVAPHMKSGRMKALAVSSAQPSTLAPGLPTVAASGLPGFSAVSDAGMFAPAKTQAAIITRLNQEVVRVLNSAEVKEKFLGTGVETVGSSPEQLAATVKADSARLGKLIKDAGIREE